MKSFYLSLCLFFLIHASLHAQQNSSGLRAAAAEVAITPPLGTYMVEPQAARASGVHDDLFLRLLVIHDGSSPLVMASYDLVGLEPALADQIRKTVAEGTRIPVENIMLNCTHAHNVPLTVNLGDNRQKRNFDWEEELKSITLKTVQQALERLVPATVAVGTAEVQLAFNRRLMMFNRARMIPNPYGPVVKQTQAIEVSFENGPSAILFTYPAHPVAVHAESAEFTADFPGFAIQAIKKERGQDVIPIFFQGCAGDINVDPLRGGYEAASRVGFQLSEAVTRAIETSERLPVDAVKTVSEKFYLPYRPITTEVAEKVILRVEEGMAALQASGSDSINILDQQDVLHWAHQLKALAEEPEKYPGLPFEMQVFVFNKDLAVIAFTHEMFVEYQLYIQENSPFRHTMVLAYTNGNAAYIPTAEAFYLNGYEVHGAQHRYGTPYLTPECDKIIKENALRVLNTLYAAY